MPEKKDRINCESSDKAIYDSIFAELFPELTRSEQFLFAMAYGSKLKVKKELKKKDGLFLLKDIKDPEDQASIIAVAMNDKKSVDVLLNPDEVYEIAEQYAHGGLMMLKGLRDKSPHGDFIKIVEKTTNEGSDE